MKKIMKVFQVRMLGALTGAIILASSCNKDDDYNNYPQELQPLANVLRSSGDSIGIVGTINEFRSILGDLNTTPGQTSGRREVNWDGVPVNFTNNNLFPLDFFNSLDPAASNARKKGLQYLNTGSPLRVDSSNFVDIDVAHGNEFIPFSKKKMIISAISNTSEVVFKVAGTTTNAFIKGFGIVFSDVDDANSTSLEFFNDNKSLGVYKPMARTASGPYSFLGVYFPNEKITRIKIIAGNAALLPGVKDISDNGTKDLVAYDDFFYDEPKQIQ